MFTTGGYCSVINNSGEMQDIPLEYWKCKPITNTKAISGGIQQCICSQ